MVRYPYSSGTRVGPFEIIKGISSKGGTASVYEACVRHDRDRRVALKIANNNNPHSEIFEDLLVKETDFLDDFRHPGIVRIIPIEEFGRRNLFGRATEIPNHPFYFAMEILQDTVETIMRNRQFDLAWRIELIYQITIIIDYLHLRDVAHRDLKPDNIMFRYPPKPNQIPTPVLIDFGLAEKRAMEPLVNAATISHASPERVQHLLSQNGNYKPTSLNQDRAKSDIWALGVLSYEILMNKYPFGSLDNRTALAVRITREQPDPMSSDIPRKLQELIYSMLSKDERGRPNTAEIIRALEREIEHTAPRVTS